MSFVKFVPLAQNVCVVCLAMLLRLSGAYPVYEDIFGLFFLSHLGGECQPRVQPAVSGPLRCGQTER